MAQQPILLHTTLELHVQSSKVCARQDWHWRKKSANSDPGALNCSAALSQPKQFQREPPKQILVRETDNSDNGNGLAILPGSRKQQKNSTNVARQLKNILLSFRLTNTDHQNSSAARVIRATERITQWRPILASEKPLPLKKLIKTDARSKTDCYGLRIKDNRQKRKSSQHKKPKPKPQQQLVPKSSSPVNSKIQKIPQTLGCVHGIPQARRQYIDSIQFRVCPNRR